MCISSAGRGVFLGCKCENGPPEAGLTRVMADEVERRDDDNGWEDREGRQREWQGDVRRRNDWQGVETERVEVGGQREDGNAWNGNRRREEQGNKWRWSGQQQFSRGEEDCGAEGVESGVYVRERQTSWEDWV